MLVVREAALEQLGNDLYVLQLEHGLPAVRGQDHLDGAALLRSQTLHFLHGARRNDHLDFLVHRLGDLAGIYRQAEAVGGGHHHAGLAQLELHAGQHRARFVGGGGECYQAYAGPQDAGIDVDGHAGVDLRDGREVRGVGSVDVGHGASAGQVQDAASSGRPVSVGSAQVEINPVAGTGVDPVGQQAVRNRDRPFLLDHRSDPRGDGDFEVGGGQHQHALVGAEQNVLSYRQRRSVGHRPANHAQSASQIFLKT